MNDDRVVTLRPRVPAAGVQGTLALDLFAHVDEPRPVADVVPIGASPRARFERFAFRFVQAAAEIAGGDRPVGQLVRWTSQSVYQDLGRRAQLVARAAGQRAGTGRVQAVRPQVQSVHASFIRAEAVEVSARVRYGERSRAVALRFEFRQKRWQCVALEFA